MHLPQSGRLCREEINGWLPAKKPVKNGLVEIGVREKPNLHDGRAVCNSSPARMSLARRSVGSGSAFRVLPPICPLAGQIGIDFSLVCEIVCDGAIHFFEPQQLEILADRLRRFAAAECMRQWTLARSACLQRSSCRPAVPYTPLPCALFTVQRFVFATYFGPLSFVIGFRSPPRSNRL